MINKMHSVTYNNDNKISKIVYKNDAGKVYQIIKCIYDDDGLFIKKIYVYDGKDKLYMIMNGDLKYIISIESNDIATYVIHDRYAYRIDLDDNIMKFNIVNYDYSIDSKTGINIKLKMVLV